MAQNPSSNQKPFLTGLIPSVSVMESASVSRGHWIVIHAILFFLSPFSGMVYNVTPYMDYHPGGEEELMKAAGIDGTDLFDQVWKLMKKVKHHCFLDAS